MSVVPAPKQTLALLGGTPVRSTLLPYGRHFIDEADIRAVVEVLRSDWLTGGPKVGEFEEAFAAYVGARYGVSFSSGTAALHGAAHAAGLGPGDEAVTSPLTFVATANCLLYQGARPVFADVCPDTLNLDPKKATYAINRNTRAIFPVDYAGHPVDLDAILELAEKHGLVVIEDACHSLGATYHGRRTGSIAHMTIFSFHPVKHLAVGEGGMVTTNNRVFADALRRFRNHGISSDARERQISGQWHYAMLELGYNYRLTDIACALGLSQLKKLDANLVRRRTIAGRYTDTLCSLSGIILPTIRPGVDAAWHLYPIRLELGNFAADRDQFLRALRAENVGVNVHYIPVHLHSYYRHRFGYHGGEYPVAECAYQRLISLPIFPGMNDTDIGDVTGALRKVVAHFSTGTNSG